MVCFPWVRFQTNYLTLFVDFEIDRYASSNEDPMLCSPDAESTLEFCKSNQVPGGVKI